MKNEVDFKPLVETFIINDVQSFNHFKNKYSMFPVAEVIHLGKDITSDINYLYDFWNRIWWYKINNWK